jgi:hypothetical protein
MVLAIRCSWLPLMIGSLEHVQMPFSIVQKDWDKALVDIQEKVLSAAPDQTGKARLIAAAAPHSGAFLHTRPRLSLG